MIDIDLILRSVIAGIVGGEIANWLSGKNRAVKPSFLYFTHCVLQPFIH